MSLSLIALLTGLMVSLVVFKSLWVMAQKGSESTSQQLMRFRVLAQAVAVAAIVIAAYLIR